MKNRRATPAPFSIEWKDITLTGTATYTPGDPGKYSGPPEKCYPSEPAEVEIATLFYKDWDISFMLESDEFAEEVCNAVQETYEVEDYPEYEPSDMTDAEADADTLRSAGMGTDEDYGYFGGNDE